MAEPDAYLALTTLPEPTLVFTLPSLHDGLPLDCRVYHPLSLSPAPPKNQNGQQVQLLSWRRHAAIVAHPYAPLGGSYDDPVVGVVASTLLRLGFLVMTFNFRGAHGSVGRTSWTAKAERADYMSAVGFLSLYVHFLDPYCRLSPPSDDGRSTADTPILIMGGYSYGAMITTQVPNLPTILKTFDAPICLSHAAEIRLRAQHLAEGQNTVLSSARAAILERQSGRSSSPRKSLGLRVGGDEDIRSSHESRRHSLSFDAAEDKIRKGVADLMAKARKGHKRWHTSSEDSTVHGSQDGGDQNTATKEQNHEQEGVEEHEHLPAHECLVPIPGRITPRPAYLLISPLQGAVTNFATMSFSVPFSRSGGSWKPFGRRSSSPKPEKVDAISKDDTPSEELSSIQDKKMITSPSEAEQKLTSNHTLAIYGDRDGFVAARKLREWGSRLQSVPGSKFRAHEVSNAGHFWTQGRVAYTMRDAVKTFASGLLSEGGS